MINNPKIFGIGILNKEDMYNRTYLYSVKYNNENKDIYEQSKELKSYLNNNKTNIIAYNLLTYLLSCLVYLSYISNLY